MTHDLTSTMDDDLRFRSVLRMLLATHAHMWWWVMRSILASTAALAPLSLLASHSAWAIGVGLAWAIFYGFMLSFSVPITVGVARDLIRSLRGQRVIFVGPAAAADAPPPDQAPPPKRRAASRFLSSLIFWSNPLVVPSALAADFVAKREARQGSPGDAPAGDLPLDGLRQGVYRRMRRYRVPAFAQPHR